MRRHQKNEPFYRRTLARRKQKRPSPRVELVEKAGSVELSTDHPNSPLGNALIMESLGTADFEFYDGLLSQLINVGTQGKNPDERGTNFMLAMVRGVGPKDEIEAMMAAQMAAVNARRASSRTSCTSRASRSGSE